MASVAIPQTSFKVDEHKKKTKKRVWFPVDEHGEPHPANPEDGFGGAKFTLTEIRLKYFYDDKGCILEGANAHVAAREETIGKNWRETCNLVRKILITDIQSFQKLESEIYQLEDPWLAQLGAVWRQNFGRMERTGEKCEK
jgi:hypothetical protein